MRNNRALDQGRTRSVRLEVFFERSPTRLACELVVRKRGIKEYPYIFSWNPDGISWDEQGGEERGAKWALG